MKTPEQHGDEWLAVLVEMGEAVDGTQVWMPPEYFKWVEGIQRDAREQGRRDAWNAVLDMIETYRGGQSLPAVLLRVEQVIGDLVDED